MSPSKLTAALAAFLALTAAIHAETPERKSQTYALLIGVGKYTDPQILARPHAEDDIRAVYDLLTNKDYLGLDKDHIRLLTGTADAGRQGEVATRENVLQALRWLGSTPGKDDVVILFWAGEGAPIGERACYFASDSTFKDRAKNAVAGADVESALEKLKTQRFCAFVDVNFKGFNPGKESAPDMNFANFYHEFLTTPKDTVKEEQNAPNGRILFLANTGLQQSLDLDKHGLFEQVVLDGLSGKADREGYEPDGEVTVDEMVEYVNKELPALAREHGKTREEKEQRDFIMGGRVSNYALTRNPAALPAVRARIEKFDRAAGDEKLSSKLVKEGKDLLAHMPKLEAYRSLRKKYQALADGKLTADELVKERERILGETALGRTAALEYAAKIIQASDLIAREYVKKVNQGELISAAIKGLYQRIDEKIPADLRARMERAKNLNEDDLRDLLADAREHLGKREDLDNHKDIDFALQHMMLPLDPYTTYIDPETVAQFKRETNGNFIGIGIIIRVDSATDMITVVTPIKGSPAYQAGMRAGDLITKITRDADSEGHPFDKPEATPTKGLAINDAVKKIVGRAGTKVRLTVQREGEAKPLEFDITRGAVEVETVLGVRRKPDDTWDYVLDRENGICYARVTMFARNTARDLQHVLKYLKDSLKDQGGIRGFILDLRFDPGGLLTSAIDVSDLFIDDGVIVTVRPRGARESVHTGEHEGSWLDFPMVCLVNGHSASGSEIVSACLQDHHRALIAGERSYGKGSVQNIQPFEDGELKLTTASFWRPSGKNLNRSSTSGKEDAEWGVTPDKGFLIKLSRKERDELEDHLHRLEVVRPKEPAPDFKDRQLDTALQYLRDQIRLASSRPAKDAG